MSTSRRNLKKFKFRPTEKSQPGSSTFKVLDSSRAWTCQFRFNATTSFAQPPHLAGVFSRTQQARLERTKRGACRPTLLQLLLRCLQQPNMVDRAALKQQVQAITACNDYQAQVVLERSNWELERAIDSYFDNQPPEVSRL